MWNRMRKANSHIPPVRFVSEQEGLGRMISKFWCVGLGCLKYYFMPFFECASGHVNFVLFYYIYWLLYVDSIQFGIHFVFFIHIRLLQFESAPLGNSEETPHCLKLIGYPGDSAYKPHTASSLHLTNASLVGSHIIKLV